MCFSTPDPPKLKPLPLPPSVNAEEVRQREARERLMMATAGQGTPGTVKTDLTAADVQGQQRRIKLGV